MPDNICPTCERSYSRARDMRAHVTRAHGDGADVVPAFSDATPVAPVAPVMTLRVAPVSELGTGDVLAWRGIEQVVRHISREPGALVVRFDANHRLHFPHGNVRIQMRSGV